MSTTAASRTSRSRRNEAAKVSEESQIVDNIRPQDSVSHADRSSVLSSSVEVRRLELSAKRAAILAEASLAKEQYELELKQADLRRQMQDIEVRKRIAAVEAEDNVLAQAEVDEHDHRDDHSDVIVSNAEGNLQPQEIAVNSQDGAAIDSDPEITFKSNLDPQVTEFVPRDNNIATWLQQNHMQNAQLVEAVRLPAVELMYFNGDPIAYWPFIRAFENCVASRTVDDGGKLARLLHYCTGSARRVIECCAVMSPVAGYARARELLAERFGNRFVILQAWIKKVTSGATITSNDRQQLQQFADDLTCCRETLLAMNCCHEVNNQSTLLKIIQRLPAYLQNRWRREVGNLRSQSKSPGIDDVVTFVANAAAEANDPVYGQLTGAVRPMEKQLQKDYKARPRTGTSLAIASGKSCVLCNNGSHALFQCNKFLGMKLNDRTKYAKENKLCFNCLSYGHMSKGCESSYRCKVPGCNGKHSKLLHKVKPLNERDAGENNCSEMPQSSNVTDAQCSCTATGAGGHCRIALPIVPVTVASAIQPSKGVSTYALLDSGSTNSFCSSQLVNQLCITGKKTSMSLATLDKVSSLTEMQSVSLQITGMNTGVDITLPNVYVRPDLHIKSLEAVKSADLTQWPHLSNITFPDVSLSEVSLLIGQDVPQALIPLEVRNGSNGGPYAVRTCLGWVLNGPISDDAVSEACVNYIYSERSLDEQVEKFWKLETCEQRFGELAPSVNDQRVIAIWEESIRIKEGHYEMAIPFKFKPNLPNNRELAVRRLESLRKKLTANPVILHEYKNGVKDLLAKQYATKVPEDQLGRNDGAVWYLPHHYVIHPRKQKLRIVFDCASKYQGVSLNDCVWQGPDLTNKLVGVLIRFRQEHIAIMADIEAMFCQVGVASDHQDVLRFLWWPDGDMSRSPETYKMIIHLFGGVWSPSCANFALQHTAADNESEFPSEIIQCILRNFYVDDFLKSLPTQRQAVDVISQLSELLARGGFHLTKWVSSSREVLQSVAKENRAQDVKTLDLSQDTLPSECALGVFWDVQSDSFGFRTIDKNKPFTRRGILSVVSSVYDPLGLVCPFILPAKLIVQELCRKKYGWDDELPADEVVRWQQWLDDLPRVQQLNIKRCLKPCRDSQVQTYSLHHFCDASHVGYGVASYIKMDFVAEVQDHCCLVFGKSRLAPIKSTTIPRLELMAAVLAVKVDKMLRSELDYKIQESFFWTDSTIVLRYIANHDKRFHTFVANRVSVILDGSDPSQWRCVPSDLNPADDASRGMRIDELQVNRRWFEGPEFLCQDVAQYPTLPVMAMDIEGLEVKKEVKSYATAVDREPQESVIDRMFARYSTWYDLKKCVAWLLRVKAVLKNRVRKIQTAASSMLTPLSVSEIQQAETAIVLYVQLHAFDKKLKQAKMQSEDSEFLKSCYGNDLRKLSPVLSADGILCVGGRLRKAAISDEAKHPMIIPKDAAIAKLIVRHYHVASNHSGQEHTLALIRQKFWIVKARVVVRMELSRCYQCKKLAARVCCQRMADLPTDRVTPNKPPFTYVGVDYFGPFMVKQGRSLVKRYGCLFTCLATRAVHLEVAYSLDTDSFISALRRFMCRRGTPEIIRSDNGGNFVGAEKELRMIVQGWNQARIADSLRKKETTWIFNPPASPHMGGVWERMVRSVKKVLTILMNEQTLTDETLMTLLCEVESTLNSRPITVVSEDPSDAEPLTPNHLLLMRSTAAPAVNEVERRDMYRRRWKQVQYLAALFWKRWTKEYLPILQQRHKWTDHQPNLKVNDVVIVTDEPMQRSSWPIARVVEVFPGDDGLVRSARVKSSSSTLIRPVSKLCLLESAG